MRKEVTANEPRKVMPSKAFYLSHPPLDYISFKENRLFPAFNDVRT